MKTPIRFAVFLCAFFFASTMSIFAQGILTPPGAPAPTMKSLDQIEPRTPISSLPFTISSSGSYYLTKSLSVSSSDGVTINASGVTLDLNGFEISSTEASPAHSGIVVATGLRNIRISNGSIRGNVAFSGGNNYGGAGFANGIQISGSAAAPINIHVSDLSISGCLVYGINLGGGLVEACNLSNIGGNGINADTVVYCYVYPCGGIGITANISAIGCTAVVTSSFAAIQTEMAIGCAGQGSPASGMGAITAQIARDCNAQGNAGSAGDAILANTADNCNGVALGTGSAIHCLQSALNCYGTSSGGAAAVHVTGGSALNCHGVASGNGIGLSALSAENCYGSSTGANSAGIDVANGSALNCYGVASGGGDGLSALNAQNCYGQASTGNGLVAWSAENCRGLSNASTGLRASVALNCYGENSIAGATDPYNYAAVVAGTAQNCFGYAHGGGGFGLYFTQIAAFCSGATNGGGGVNLSGTGGSHQYFCGTGATPYP